MSKPTNMFRKSLQKFDKQKIRTPTNQSLKCYICGHLLLGQSFLQHSKSCSRGLKRVQLPKINGPQSKLKKKVVNMTTTQPIMIESARTKSLNKSGQEEEFMIVKKWIQGEGEEKQEEGNGDHGVMITMQPQIEEIRKIATGRSRRSGNESPNIQKKEEKVKEIVEERDPPTCSETLSTKQFFEEVEGIDLNCTNRQKIIQLILDTDFQSNAEYSYLSSFKDQLFNIEQILFAMSGINQPSSFTKYTTLQTQIITSILNSKQYNPYQQPSPIPSHPQTPTPTLSQSDIQTQFPQIQNFKPTTCGICSSNLSFGEKCRQLPCSHKYHKQCIDSMLPHCPICNL